MDTIDEHLKHPLPLGEGGVRGHAQECNIWGSLMPAETLSLVRPLNQTTRDSYELTQCSKSVRSPFDVRVRQPDPRVIPYRRTGGGSGGRVGSGIGSGGGGGGSGGLGGDSSRQDVGSGGTGAAARHAS